mmetsp:Transcript_12824/g.32850  ORF Transcript_12824/g.32850 Transcript_12824/m.32850 type:complete len:215 (-) Transcript_12824:478-1122(-)
MIPVIAAKDHVCVLIHSKLLQAIEYETEHVVEVHQRGRAIPEDHVLPRLQPRVAASRGVHIASGLNAVGYSAVLKDTPRRYVRVFHSAEVPSVFDCWARASCDLGALRAAGRVRERVVDLVLVERVGVIVVGLRAIASAAVDHQGSCMNEERHLEPRSLGGLLNNLLPEEFGLVDPIVADNHRLYQGVLCVLIKVGNPLRSIVVVVRAAQFDTI